MMRRHWKLRPLIWLALPLLLWWALRDVSLADTWYTLRGLNLVQMAILVSLNALILLAFNCRWWLILRAQGYQIPYFPLVGYRMAAFSISYFTPGTQFGGEPLQVYLLTNKHRIPGSTALAAVTLDKLFDLLANFTFLTIGIIVILNNGLFAGWTNHQALLLVGGLLSLPLAYLLFLWVGWFPLTKLIDKLPASLTNRPAFKVLSPSVASIESQISSLFWQQPTTILWIIFISGLTWLLLLVEYWLTLDFLGAQINLSQTISALTAARIAFLTPLPGGLGALEASQVLAMQALGFNPALGISVSLLIRGRDVSLGLLGLWWGAILSRRRSDNPLPAHAGN